MRYLMIIFMFLPLMVQAQSVGFDVVSVEAYIMDHRHQRSLLMARATIESGNALLHKTCASTSSDYKALNIDLDKYTRAFDIIDLLYQTTRTALNVHKTYGNITETVTGYKEMLELFHERCLKRGNIETADTLIITVNTKCIKKILGEVETIWSSMNDLVVYATGAAACTSSDLMRIMESINESLDRMRMHLSNAYFQTWKYIQVRTGYWKAQVYRSHSIDEITGGAFGRWLKSTKQK